MALEPSVREAMLSAVPSLRAFAISLSGNVDRADDLVQETLLRAMANIDSFQPGTNMSAWLFTILRNLFRSEYRKRRGRLGRDVQTKLGKTLQAYFDDVVKEGVPDRFKDLLQQYDERKDKGSS